MSAEPIILAVPSKGRLMEKTAEIFASAGMPIRRTGHERGYQGAIDEVPAIEVAFQSAAEIAEQLKLGRVHMGVTGEDLIRETISDADKRIEFLQALGFGHANVVVAVPECWIDVNRVIELEDVAELFRRRHGRQLRVATSYMNLTRRFLAERGVAGYRIVESVGATEGAPAAGTAEAIVDITSTGTTLRANHLKVLEDGLILRSEANLVASRTAIWPEGSEASKAEITKRLAALGT